MLMMIIMKIETKYSIGDTVYVLKDINRDRNYKIRECTILGLVYERYKDINQKGERVMIEDITYTLKLKGYTGKKTYKEKHIYRDPQDVIEDLI